MEVIDEVASTLKMDRDVLARASVKVFLERELRRPGGPEVMKS